MCASHVIDLAPPFLKSWIHHCVYRPLAVGVSVGVAKHVATILEYNAWVFSMGHKYRECVCSSFAVNQNKWNA